MCFELPDAAEYHRTKFSYFLSSEHKFFEFTLFRTYVIDIGHWN